MFFHVKTCICLPDVVGVNGSPSSDRAAGGDTPRASFDLDDSRRHVRQQDIDALKQTAVTVLSESLFKKIQEINQVILTVVICIYVYSTIFNCIYYRILFNK